MAKSYNVRKNALICSFYIRIPSNFSQYDSRFYLLKYNIRYSDVIVCIALENTEAIFGHFLTFLNIQTEIKFNIYKRMITR